MTWDELENSGELMGYDSTSVDYITADVIERTPCENCGSHCRSVGRTNYRGSYRAFSVCENCGRVIEV